MENIIIPGFYQKKDSISSDKPEIIRIIGPNIKTPDGWLTFDKKTISSYDLIENYILLNLSSTETPINNKPPKSIFEGLTSISIEEDPLFTTPKEIQIETPTKPIEKINFVSKPQPTEIEIILNKIKIDTINKKNIDEIKKPIIDISIPVKLNYEVKKLQDTIKLMDLNTNDVVDTIINEISITDIKPLVKKYLINLLNDENKDINNNNNQNISIQNIDETLKLKEKNQNIIEQEIFEINNIIKKYV